MVMFSSRKKSVSIDEEVEYLRKSVSMEYARYDNVIAIKKERPQARKAEVEKKEVEKDEVPCLDFDFNEENIVQAMVYSEIFGKPKCKRRKR